MRILLALMLAAGAAAVVACSSDKSYEIEDAHTVSLGVTGMT